MIVPALALAKQEMTIDSEGDPEDGLDFAGGGSGTLNGDNDKSSSKSLDPDFDSFSFEFDIYPQFNFFLVVPLYFQSPIHFIFLDDIQWKAKK